jgi:hypothetical protein
MSAPGFNSFFPGMQAPIWYPPIESRWIITILIVLIASLYKRFNPTILKAFKNPIVFFIISLMALSSYKLGFPPGAFAILFLLLIVWSSQITNREEGYLNASNTIDWVTNSQRWFVEKVLKERPLAIQEKSVDTLPIQSTSSQSGSSVGNT